MIFGTGLINPINAASPVSSGKANIIGQVEDYGEIGSIVADNKVGNAGGEIAVESFRINLVGHARKPAAIPYSGESFLERWLDNALIRVRTGGAEQKERGARAHIACIIAQQQRSYCIGKWRSARLAGKKYGHS